MTTKEKKLKSLRKARKVLAQKRKLNGKESLRSQVRAWLKNVVQEELSRLEG